MGSDLPPLILASYGTGGAHFIYGGHMGSYGGHMGVIWGSYGGHMRLMEVLWCHMGIILEAYGGYFKNVLQTYGSDRDPPPFGRFP